MDHIDTVREAGFQWLLAARGEDVDFAVVLTMDALSNQVLAAEQDHADYADKFNFDCLSIRSEK